MIADPIYDLSNVALERASEGYLSFLPAVTVDAQPDKLTFEEIAEDWQKDREERSAGAIDQLAGYRDDYTGPLRFWHGYHKGSDKTHAIARKLCWLLGFTKRRLHLYVCAGDRDQASLITMAMTGVIQDNPWIGDHVRVSNYGATGVLESDLTVLAMDAWTGQGIFPDYIVAEEITHWMYDEGRDFWNFVLSSVNKRPQCVLEVCTNAGHKGSWQEQARKIAKDSKFWSFYEAPEGPALATWMNQERIAEDAKNMDKGEADRLYKNRWIDPGEERGYLTLEEAEGCVDVRLVEKTRGDPNLRYYAIVDYGEVNDRCALCVMHNVPGSDRVILDRLDCWQGSHADRILIDYPIVIDEQGDQQPDLSIRSVEGWFELTRRNFKLAAMIFDPYQMAGLVQKFRRKNVRVETFEYMTGKRNYNMAQLLRTMVQNKRLTWSPQAGHLEGADDHSFALELSRLLKKPMSYGYKFDHESNGHDDRAAAVGMGLLFCMPETRPGGKMGPSTVDRPKPQPMEPVGPRPAMNWAAQRGLFGMR